MCSYEHKDLLRTFPGNFSPLLNLGFAPSFLLQFALEPASSLPYDWQIP